MLCAVEAFGFRLFENIEVFAENKNAVSKPACSLDEDAEPLKIADQSVG